MEVEVFLSSILFLIVQSNYCYALFRRSSSLKRISQSPDFFEAMNCEFRNEWYESNQNGVFDVRFGSVAKAELFMPIPADESFESIKRNLMHFNKQVISQHECNCFTNFINFYRNFNGANINDLRTHFNSYSGDRLNYGSESYGLAKEVLDKFNLHYQRIPAKLYTQLGTVYTGITTDRLRSITDDSGESFPKKFHHDITVAVVKVKVQHQKWYLVADPYRGITKIVSILYENESSQTDSAYIPDIGQNLYFKLLRGRKRKYILGETADSQYRDLYFVELPYCSFLQTTAKLRLLNPAGSIYKRDKAGIVTSKISFDLTNSTDMFQLFYISNGRRRTENIPFSYVPAEGEHLVNQAGETYEYYDRLFARVITQGLTSNRIITIDALHQIKEMVNAELDFLALLERLKRSIYEERDGF